MKNNQKLSVLFWHRKSKADETGSAPIMCRITVDSSEAEFSIGKKIPAKYWNMKTKRVSGCQEAKMLNSRIKQIETDLERHFFKLQFEFDYITPIMVRNVYKGLPADYKPGDGQASKENRTYTLLELTDQYVQNFSEMVRKGIRSAETLRQWKATRNKIAEFIVKVYHSADLDLDRIDYSFATKFYKYLTIEREKVIGEAAAKKQIKNAKQLLSIAESKNLIEKNPIQKFRCGGDETDVAPLEYEQVYLLWNKKLSILRLEEVRDVFILQCFTGFAFQDVYSLSEQHIVNVGRTGEKWIVKERGKTGVTEMVPMMPIVEEILSKYKNHECRKVFGQLIPVNSNSKYNAYLKEIAMICGLNRELNTHLARHTFADMMLNVFEFSLEEVSKMLGHKTIRTTQRYAKIKKNRISRTWENVKSKVFDQDGKLINLSI